MLARLEVLDARLPKGQRQAAVQPLAAHGEAALLARIKHRLDRCDRHAKHVVLVIEV